MSGHIDSLGRAQWVHKWLSVVDVRTAQQRHPCELASSSYHLSPGALARGRPLGVRSIRERRDGDDDETVVARYNDLMTPLVMGLLT